MSWVQCFLILSAIYLSQNVNEKTRYYIGALYLLTALFVLFVKVSHETSIS